ncbi:DNA-packaging protein [Pseudomonas sp. Irchel 3E13]|uniref:DNA-packaging protein n=1 Tax=Pseudomonas sp. Irchel 3E13 TaxID=2008975 RepID=UPI001179A857|nr:DNA-packaging protein [Pseudomonas sp. Irchel 3E13]
MSAALKPFLAWMLAVGLAVAGLAINHSAGYDAGFAAAKAEGEEALAKQALANEAEKRQAAELANKALQVEADKLVASHAYGAQLATELGDTKDRLRAVTDKLSREVNRVTTLYRRALDAQLEPLPPADFTAGFVRVWNSALFGTTAAAAVPASSTTTSGADASGPGAGAADDLIVGITRADLLTNHNRNSEQYAVCRAQLNDLIKWNSKNGHN